MSMINEQVKELRKAAKWFDAACFPEGSKLANEAADTIESLSFKLQAKNMELAAEDYGGGWIPCEDRLPEEYGEYLVAWKHLYMTKDQMIESVGRVVPHFYEIVEYDPDDDKKWIGDIEQENEEYEIIAWQLLPEPYHGTVVECQEEKEKQSMKMSILSKEAEKILTSVLEERKRQDEKWGEQNHIPPVWGMIIGEEYGEMCQAINEFGFNPTPEIEEQIYIESIHTMASCMAMLECLERMRCGKLEKKILYGSVIKEDSENEYD